MAAHRDLTPIMKFVRDAVSFRKIKPPARFRSEPGTVSARTQPPPNLPDGSNGALSANSYCMRDARRLNNPPTAVFIAGQKLLPPPGSDGAEVAREEKSSLKITPGYGYDYGSHREYYSGHR